MQAVRNDACFSFHSEPVEEALQKCTNVRPENMNEQVKKYGNIYGATGADKRIARMVWV